MSAISSNVAVTTKSSSIDTDVHSPFQFSSPLVSFVMVHMSEGLRETHFMFAPGASFSVTDMEVLMRRRLPTSSRFRADGELMSVRVPKSLSSRSPSRVSCCWSTTSGAA